MRRARLVREVAPARIALPRPDHPGEVLSLQVALIRDLRRLVPVQPSPEDAELPQRWDADLPRTERQWWEEGWQATAAPATADDPQADPHCHHRRHHGCRRTGTDLHPPLACARKCHQRLLTALGIGHQSWLCENARGELGGGQAAKPACNKRRAKLKQWAQECQQRSHQAGKRHDRLRVQHKSRADELYRELGLHQTTLELQGVADHVLRREIKERKAVIDAELEQIRVKEWRAYEQCNQEFRKQERYCKEQRDVLRALEDLEAKERTMYELDQRKDQVMTVCKVALANLAMWVRDHYFPASYAHATWLRLVPFFRLPGRIMRDATTVHVELRPFNDRALNRDLALLCERVNEASPQLPDGHFLRFTISSPCRILPAQEHRVT